MLETRRETDLDRSEERQEDQAVDLRDEQETLRFHRYGSGVEAYLFARMPLPPPQQRTTIDKL
jgi:hypothetical protein